MTDEETDEIEPSMEDIAERISFRVSARATDANKDVHQWFKQTSWDYCDGDYTERLRMLRREEKSESQYKLLADKVMSLSKRLDSLEMALADAEDEDTDEDKEAF